MYVKFIVVFVSTLQKIRVCSVLCNCNICNCKLLLLALILLLTKNFSICSSSKSLVSLSTINCFAPFFYKRIQTTPLYLTLLSDDFQINVLVLSIPFSSLVAVTIATAILFLSLTNVVLFATKQQMTHGLNVHIRMNLTVYYFM